MRRKKSFTRAEKKAYEISNRLDSVDFRVTPSMRRKVDDLALWLAAGDKTRVRASTQAVIDLLCAAAQVPVARIALRERAYAKFKGDKAVWKLYGLCAPDGTITLAFRTAVRRKVFAFKTFVNTLVHEFMHHYDTQRLQLGASFHTRGFYQRVRDLICRLVPATP
jgi:hypothetical protein